MKAIGFDHYGGTEVLELKDVELPDLGEDGVLVRVRAAALNPRDWHVVTGLPLAVRPTEFGLRPKVTGVGSDLAGQVTAVGPGVTRFRPGDEVYGQVDPRPGSSLPALGSVAEHVRVSASSIRPRPADLTAEEAAAVPLAGITALWALRDVGRLQPGQHVLVNGASGGVGTFAVQIARAMGAEVTAVCSTRNLDLVRSLGADHVVDYTRDDFTRGSRRYDLLLDNVGSRGPAACRRVLEPDGTYVASFDHPENRWLGPLGHVLRMTALSRFTRQRMVLLQPERRDEDLDTLTALLESGAVRPVIDRVYPMAETREAMDHLAGRHARGKVVVTVQEF